ncbi:hypothetical protein DTL42_03040 [Bremerella cremea]|uniref:RNA polymerase sigma-70 ECF-like HTH domain-containing protein n=1 Tax=Bremerella cremea TaxID=1031537 RepID=A0A368KUN7_9BACT|nr:ECF-type sigma factor [Bremerella cremea]RCS54140.1 hypothetical protein DTL42_03040 [Bremerella cremea]
MCEKLFDTTPLSSTTSTTPAEMKSVEAHFNDWLQQRQLKQQESARLIWGRYIRRLRVKARAFFISESMGGRDRDNVAFRAANAMFDASEKQELDPNDKTSDLWKIVLFRAAINIQQKDQAGALSLSVAEILGEAPSARLCIHFAEALEQTIRLRLDDQLRNVLFLRLEGCGNSEIAQRIGKQEAEVEPQLTEIRQRLVAAKESNV